MVANATAYKLMSILSATSNQVCNLISPRLFPSCQGAFVPVQLEAEAASNLVAREMVRLRTKLGLAPLQDETAPAR